METSMMIQEYTGGPRKLAGAPTYKLWTYQEAMEVQSKNNWIMLAVVLGLAGAVSGFLLRSLYLGDFDSSAIVANHTRGWIYDMETLGGYTALVVLVGAALGVLIAFLVRNLYAKANFGWTWFSSGLVLPLATYVLAPVVLWVVTFVLGLLLVALILGAIWFVWNIISG